jgi:hypothetical protein
MQERTLGRVYLVTRIKLEVDRYGRRGTGPDRGTWHGRCKEHAQPENRIARIS